VDFWWFLRSALPFCSSTCPLLNPARLIAVLLLAICVVGGASANHRVQAIIAVLGLLIEIFLVGYLRFDPGSWYGAQ
jgi:hypothetical protein